MNLAVLGAQWGDEGKGKIVDLLTANFSIVARYQGGHNAGHTVYVSGKKFILRLIPSGILHPGVTCVIGNGVVVDPQALFAELDDLAKNGIDVGNRLVISDKAHLILPYHRDLDLLSEARRGERKIGTTSRGIVFVSLKTAGSFMSFQKPATPMPTKSLYSPPHQSRTRAMGCKPSSSARSADMTTSAPPPSVTRQHSSRCIG